MALFATNIAVIATVGLVSYHLLRQKFNEQVAQTALANFKGDVISFIETYGSWQAGIAKEPFGAFVARREKVTRRPAILGPGHPEVHPAPDSPPVRLEPVAKAAADSPPPALSVPPFRFMIFSADGTILLAIPPYQAGQRISESDRASAEPIEHSGKTLAYVVTKGEAAYSSLDFGYVSAIRQALLLGTGAGLILAILTGWVMGIRLSSRLRTLTEGIQRVRNGQLDHRVVDTSKDEVGELARAFNHMSDELRSNRDSLRESYSRIEKQAEVLRELSTRDSLTHLHNRRYFDEQMARIAHIPTSGAAVMLGDVDFFKQINDRFSHAIGDSVLYQIGEILRKNIRQTDIVARYGGEEFAAAFTNITMDQAYRLCEKLRAAVADHPWHKIHAGLQVTMSFGVAHMDGDISPEDLVKAADGSLYQAKSEGRNKVCNAHVVFPADVV